MTDPVTITVTVCVSRANEKEGHAEKSISIPAIQLHIANWHAFDSDLHNLIYDAIREYTNRERRDE